MNNPPYLALVPKEIMHKVIEEGIAGTAMPGYAAKVGGMLTDEQINILVDGIYHWAKGHEAPTDNLPPYSAPWEMRNAENRFSRRIAPIATVRTGKA